MKTNKSYLPLGTKVTCKGYLKKTGKGIHNNENEQRQYCKAHNIPFERSESGYYDNFGNPIAWEEFVYTRQFVEKLFVGFICGKKVLHTAIFPIGLYDAYGSDVTSVWKDKVVECYEVCVENKNHSWGKRYVPIDKVEVCDEQ